MSQIQSKPDKEVRINITLKNEPAEWLLEWKRRGLVKSNADAVRTAFREFQNVITERDLQQRKLQDSKRYK